MSERNYYSELLGKRFFSKLAMETFEDSYIKQRELRESKESEKVKGDITSLDKRVDSLINDSESLINDIVKEKETIDDVTLQQEPWGEYVLKTKKR